MSLIVSNPYNFSKKELAEKYANIIIPNRQTANNKKEYFYIFKNLQEDNSYRISSEINIANTNKYKKLTLDEVENILKKDASTYKDEAFQELKGRVKNKYYSIPLIGYLRKVLKTIFPSIKFKNSQIAQRLKEQLTTQNNTTKPTLNLYANKKQKPEPAPSAVEIYKDEQEQPANKPDSQGEPSPPINADGQNSDQLNSQKPIGSAPQLPAVAEPKDEQQTHIKKAGAQGEFIQPLNADVPDHQNASIANSENKVGQTAQIVLKPKNISASPVIELFKHELKSKFLSENHNFDGFNHLFEELIEGFLHKTPQLDDAEMDLLMQSDSDSELEGEAGIESELDVTNLEQNSSFDSLLEEITNTYPEKLPFVLENLSLLKGKLLKEAELTSEQKEALSTNFKMIENLPIANSSANGPSYLKIALIVAAIALTGFAALGVYYRYSDTYNASTPNQGALSTRVLNDCLSRYEPYVPPMICENFFHLSTEKKEIFYKKLPTLDHLQDVIQRFPSIIDTVLQMPFEISVEDFEKLFFVNELNIDDSYKIRDLTKKLEPEEFRKFYVELAASSPRTRGMLLDHKMQALQQKNPNPPSVINAVFNKTLESKNHSSIAVSIPNAI